MADEKQEETKSLPKLTEMVERLEKANAEAKVILERNEELAAKNILGGVSDAGIQPVEPKELTPKEYKDAVMSGKINFQK